LVNELAQYLNGHPAAQGYLRLGLLLEQIGRRPEAQQAFAQARRLDPRLVLPPMTEEFHH
jgi:Flp pilus assembly protein TadD